MRLIFGTLLLLSAACSTNPTREAQNRKRASLVEEKLRPGMTYEQVSRDFPEMGNCRGSPKGLQSCELNYLISSTSGWAFREQGGLDTEKYRRYSLNFEKGVLKTWNPEDETKIRP
jgi:hypothetical protein